MPVERLIDTEINNTVRSIGVGKPSIEMSIDTDIIPTITCFGNGNSDIFLDILETIYYDIELTAGLVVLNRVIDETIVCSVRSIGVSQDYNTISIDEIIEPYINVYGVDLTLISDSVLDNLNLDYKKYQKELMQTDVISDLGLIKDKLNLLINITNNTVRNPEYLDSQFAYGYYPGTRLMFLEFSDYEKVIDETIRVTTSAYGDKGTVSISIDETLNYIINIVGIELPKTVIDETISATTRCIGLGNQSKEHTIDDEISHIVRAWGEQQINKSTIIDSTIYPTLRGIGTGLLDIVYVIDEVITNIVVAPSYAVNEDIFFSIDEIIENEVRCVGEGSINIVIEVEEIIEIQMQTSFKYLEDIEKEIIETINPIIYSQGFGNLDITKSIDEIFTYTIGSSFTNIYDKVISIDEYINTLLSASGIGIVDITKSVDDYIGATIRVDGIGASIQSTSVDETINITISASGVGEEYPDTEDPVITLIGSTSITLDLGETYIEPGYSASDNYDGDITDDVIITGSININSVGTYTLYYTVKDAAGNTDQRTRTIHVEDNIPPTIDLIGSSIINLSQGDVFLDPGATASDNYDGDLTADIVSFSNVNTEVAGSYSVIYSVTDSSGNETTTTRTVVVEYVDTEAPIISLSGLINIYLAIGGTYSEPGYSATDNTDGDITSNVVVSGSIDNSEPGTYQLTYSVSDAAGNTATPKTRNVIIEDTLPPGITLIGASTMSIEVHTSFSDPGATAYDNYDGDITGNIVIGGDVVDRHTTGTYYITYDVTDSSGNEATQVVRTVHVYDPLLQ